MADKEKDTGVSRVFTPFGVMVGDAGAMKSFDDKSFYVEVLKPSEKEMYKKFQEDFIKNPDSKKVKSGFIPWKDLPIKSNARNRLVFDKICSNTWALNKEAIPGFIDLIEKLRQKYSTVLGDDKLLEHLEAAQHRARELEVSSDVPASSGLKSRAKLDAFVSEGLIPINSDTSGLVSSQNESSVDPQAVEDYVQQMVQTGVPEDQARQMADELSKQIQENTTQFVQNVQKTESKKSTIGLGSSFKNNGGFNMKKRSYIQSGDITITHEDEDDVDNMDFDVSENFGGDDEDPLDFGSPSEDGEANLDDGFMDEVNSLDEFGSNSPELTKEEVVDAVQAIDQIIDVILATEGLVEGEAPTSEEVSFVLDEVQDLAAGFDSSVESLGDGEVSDSAEGFDEASFDADLEEEFTDEISASVVRFMKAGKSIQSKFRRPYISQENFGGVPALICNGVDVEVEVKLGEEGEPEADAVVETAVITGDDFTPTTEIESKYIRVGAIKNWIKQSKNHKLAWRIASSKYRKLLKQSAESPRDKAVVYAMANHIYNRYLKNSKNRLFKLFSNKSVRNIRRVGRALYNRFVNNKPLRVIYSDYNGYKNYQTWNVSLWINNDEKLYNRALRFAKSGKTNYKQFIKESGLAGGQTPDGVAWDDSNIDEVEMNGVMASLTSSLRGKKMKNIRSNTQVDGGDELITVQDDTDTGLDLSNETLSDSAIEDPNTQRVLRVNGGDTSITVDVDNTGNEGSLEADQDAGLENNESEYGFESLEMVGAELPIEEENKTQVLELKHIGSGVYILNRAFEAPGCGRVSFCKGVEASKLIRNNTKPVSKIRANVDRVLNIKDSNKGVILRSSSVLGVIAVEAPYTKGLKNAKYSLFCRSGLNLVNDEGYYYSMPKGPSKVIASAVSTKARRGAQPIDIFSKIESSYIKYLQGKVTELIKANFNLQTKLNKAIRSNAIRERLNSNLINKERMLAKQQVASAMQGLASLQKETAAAEAQRIISGSQQALHQASKFDKEQQERNVDYLAKMMGW